MKNVYPQTFKEGNNKNKIMNKQINEMKACVSQLEIEDIKFDKGNKAAGTRMRKILSTIIVGAKQMRKDIQNKKNGI